MEYPRNEMSINWVTEQFEVFDGGVSSAVDPRLIKNNQMAWAMNTVLRGGNPHTRPALKYCMTLPTGLFQGAGYFSIQNGIAVASIGGKLHRIRVDGTKFSSESIPLDYDNAGNRRQAWFCQTVNNLIIQDGQSYPIIYDGSTARRSDVTGVENYNKNYDADNTDEENNAFLLPEVPIGKQMAFGNGRLWVATDGSNLVAGDIITQIDGSELRFTETNYLYGGGALFFQSGITGLAFIPTTGGGEMGSLVVFGEGTASTIRADITNRNMWSQIPSFVSPLFRSAGAAGHNTIVEINQDLYWRDSQGGIRSIRSAISNEQSAGNAPISREVSRITDFESDKYVKYSSAILADNRYLCLGNPFLLDNGGVGYKSIVALDFANISTLQGKTPPAYDGYWTGLNFTQLMAGTFNGKRRNFVFSYDPDGINRMWELVDERDDSTLEDGNDVKNPIVQYVEHGRRVFGDPRSRKRLERFDVYLADVDGPVSITAYWRADNDSIWHEWSSQTVCAKTTDDSIASPHVFKLLNKQQRPQLKTFTIPTKYNSITGFQAHVGFEFQLRIKVTGNARIYRALCHATVLSSTQFNDNVPPECTEYDTTGNSISYEVPVSSATPIITQQPENDTVNFGGIETLDVGVSSEVPVKYQWYKGTTGNATEPISGARSSVYTTAPLTDSTSFWVRIFYGKKWIDSETAVINLLYLYRYVANMFSLASAELHDVIVDIGLAEKAAASYSLASAILHDIVVSISSPVNTVAQTYSIASATLRNVIVSIPGVVNRATNSYSLQTALLTEVAVDYTAPINRAKYSYGLTSASLA